MDPQAVSDHAIKDVLVSFIESIASLGAEARQGRFPMGQDVMVSLAQGLLLLSEDDPLVRDAVEALLQVCEDSAVSGEDAIRALGALALVGSRGRLSDQDRQRIRRAPSTFGPPESLWGATSPDRLAAARLLALASSLESSERGQLVALSRSTDVTARYTAVNAAVLAIHVEPDETLTWIVLSALFDPADDVVVKGLEAIASTIIESPAYGQLTVERLRALQATRGRRTRTAIAACLARSTADATHTDGSLATLVEEASRDGSWLVRQTVAPVASRDTPEER